MTQPKRACPVCTSCGGRKFERLKTEDTVVRCTSCGLEVRI